MSDSTRFYEFNWDFIGDIELGRPNLGNMTRIEMYRLFQYTLRDILERRYGTVEADRILYEAGHLAGAEFFSHYVGASDNAEDFYLKVQKAMRDMSVGVFRVESTDGKTGSAVVSVGEDLDCSGLPVHGKAVCNYDEGFLSGLLKAFSGKGYVVREVDCWCTGDRTCRFNVTPDEASPTSSAAVGSSDTVAPPSPDDRSKDAVPVEHVSTPDSDRKAAEVVSLINDLLLNPASRCAEPPTEIRTIPGFTGLWHRMEILNRFVEALSRGNLEQSISNNGYVIDCLKALQSNLRHVAWQEGNLGDGFNARVDFMGDLGDSFNTMAGKVARSLEHLRSESEHYRVLANIDRPTGVMNKEAFLEKASFEILRGRMRGTTFAILMLDIDFFKKVNDTYGHLTGDDALLEIANIIGQSFRQRDVYARFGGEEFIILLNGASMEATMSIAERLRSSIEEHKFPTRTGIHRITASIGATVIPPEWDGVSPRATIEEAISRADNYLYIAKGSGRNRVCGGERNPDKDLIAEHRANKERDVNA